MLLRWPRIVTYATSAIVNNTGMHSISPLPVVITHMVKFSLFYSRCFWGAVSRSSTGCVNLTKYWAK